MREPRRRRLDAFLALGVAIAMAAVLAPSLSSLSTHHATLLAPMSSADHGTIRASHPAEGQHARPASLNPVQVAIPNAVHPDAGVDPTRYYSAQPAPMGMADYGVTVGGNPYTYNSTEFLANFSWQGLNLHGNTKSPPSDTSFTVQLNVVLVFANGGTTYAYWIQDVALLNSTTGEVAFLDNVWNFSAPSACLTTSAVRGNGSVDPALCFYYDQAVVQPGATRLMPTPGDFSLLVRSYTAGGAPEVAFGYWDGVGGGFQTFDNVLWPWATAVSSDSNFVVNGSTYNPYGLFYDAEVILGGPGGGSSVIAQNFTDTAIRLFYWNGHNFQAPRAAWNFGSDTAETITNIQSIWLNNYTSVADGTPLMVQLNGTAFDAGLDNVYTESSVGYLNVSAPGVASGDVVVGSTDWPFVGGAANVTLTPGTYHVWVNSSAGSEDLGACTVTGGATTATAAGTGCTPTTSTPVAAPRSADVGQTVTISTTLMSSGSGGDTFAWSVTPTDLGCASSVTDTLVCRPTIPGTYAISVTVNDSSHRSMTTRDLELLVYTDPTVGLTVSRATIDAGQESTFLATASGGAPGYTYAWSGLPPGCTAVSQALLNCSPSAAGAFAVQVAATDANGWVVTATVSTTVYTDPAITSVHAIPTSVVSGAGLTLSVNLSGGRGPYSFHYTGLPSGCETANASTVACTPNETGSFSVLVVVVDADGAVANGTTELTVTATASGLPALMWYETAALLAAAVAAAAIVLGVHRRNRARQRASEPRPIVEQVGTYPRGTGPYPGGEALSPAGLLWGEGGPGVPRPSQDDPSNASAPAGGLDPGAVYLGLPLLNPPNPICWNCDFENPPSSRYCSRCGLPLDGAVER